MVLETMFFSFPSAVASLSPGPAGAPIRAVPATYVSTAVKTPAASPVTIRLTRRGALVRRLLGNRAGSRRSTSTNTTSETVSTANCVSAMSGAPCSTYSTAVP